MIATGIPTRKRRQGRASAEDGKFPGIGPLAFACTPCACNANNSAFFVSPAKSSQLALHVTEISDTFCDLIELLLVFDWIARSPAERAAYLEFLLQFTFSHPAYFERIYREMMKTFLGPKKVVSGTELPEAAISSPIGCHLRCPSLFNRLVYSTLPPSSF